MEILMVRHGESEANILQEFSNRSLKHPLTERGISQTTALAQTLADRKIQKIYSSPILRAQQTSMILAEQFHVEIEIEPALREFDVGIYEGRSDEDAWVKYRDVVQAWIHDEKFEEKLEHGESFVDQVDMFEPFLKKIVETYTDIDDAIMLVSHGGLIRCMLPHLIANLSFEYCEKYPISNTAYILLHTQANQLICKEWCGNRLDELFQRHPYRDEIL
jgi:broad specificity phosphatase PhoE